MEEETLDELIARVLAERLVELGLPADLARALASVRTPPVDGVVIAEMKGGLAVGLSRSRRSRRRLPRGRRS